MAVEAALVLTVLVTLLLGVWEVAQLTKCYRTLQDAAREGARLAAGGTNNNASVTVAMVQQSVKDYLTAAGFPSTAVDGAQVTVTNLSANSWTDPGDAQPLDRFRVTVVIPAGASFNSLRLLNSSMTGITQLSATAQWLSANDTAVSVSTQLPY